MTYEKGKLNDELQAREEELQDQLMDLLDIIRDENIYEDDREKFDAADLKSQFVEGQLKELRRTREYIEKILK